MHFSKAILAVAIGSAAVTAWAAPGFGPDLFGMGDGEGRGPVELGEGTDGAVPDPAPGGRSRFNMPANPSEGTTFSPPDPPSGPGDADFEDDPPFLSRERPLTPLEEAAFQWWERTSVFSPWGEPRPSASPQAADRMSSPRRFS